MNIWELARYLEGQINHKDGREPNAIWCLGELKKYLEEKDADSLIDDSFFNEELKKNTTCEWCNIPIDSKQDLVVVMQDMGKFRVCVECLNDYASNRYDKLISKIKQVHPQSESSKKVKG